MTSLAIRNTTPHYNFDEVRLALAGNELAILPQVFGELPTRKNENGQCPNCGGRFSWATPEGKFVYNCDGCGGGKDGFSLATKYLNDDPKRAAAALAPLLGIGEVSQATKQRVVELKAEQEAKSEGNKQKAESTARKVKRQAENIVDTAKPAQEHPYLQRKGIAHAEVLTTPVTVLAGIQLPAGSLIVPAYRGGELVTVQLISSDGNKRFLKGEGTKTGAWHLLAGNNESVLIGEGYATGLTLHQATGFTVAVCFDAVGLVSCATDIRNKYPSSTLLFCADDDLKSNGNTGLEQAQRAANSVNGFVVMPPFSKEERVELLPTSNNKEKRKYSDFNDYQQLYGGEQVKGVIIGEVQKIESGAIQSVTGGIETSQKFNAANEEPKESRKSVEIEPPLPLTRQTDPAPEYPVEAPGKEITVVQNGPPGNEEGFEPNQYPELRPEGYHGVLRDVIDLFCTDSEVIPEALALSVLTRISVYPGIDGAYHLDGSRVTHAGIWNVIVASSGAGKGTIESACNRLFREVEMAGVTLAGSNCRPLSTKLSGLSTGQGLVYAIRDKVGEEGDDDYDPGVEDKRALIVLSEFSRVLGMVKRKDETLSDTLRDFFDHEPVGVLTRTAPIKSTGAHVCLQGHITPEELLSKMDAVDAANGLLNRIMFIHASLKRLVPRAPVIDNQRLNEIAIRISDALKLLSDKREVTLTHEAWQLWDEAYPGLRLPKGESLVRSLLQRQPHYAKMLSMLFAGLDMSKEITKAHLKAALAWVDYWRESVEFIFSNEERRVAQEETEREADVCFNHIKRICAEKGKCSSSGLINAYSRNKSSREIKVLTDQLLSAVPPLIRFERNKGKRGGFFYINK